MKKSLLLAIPLSMMIAFGACKKDKKDTGTDDASASGTEKVLTVENKQRSFVGYVTATWCGPCGQYGGPNFKAAIETLGEDNVIGLNLHSSTSSRLVPYYQNAAKATQVAPIVSQLFASLQIPTNNGSYSIPAFSMNNVYQGTSNVKSADIVNIANTHNAKAPVVGVGATVTITGNDIIVKAKSKFFKEGSGEYYWAAVVYESDVKGYQLVGGTVNNNYDHKNPVKAAIINNDFENQQVFSSSFATGTVAANTEHDASWTFTYKDFSPLPTGLIPWNLNPSNTRVAVMVWKKLGNYKEFVNGVVCKP